MRPRAWNELDDPYTVRVIFESTGGKIGARRCRLFLCACCRRIPCVQTDDVMLSLLELAERAADGLVKHKELAEAARSAQTAIHFTGSDEMLNEARRIGFRVVGSAAAPKTMTWTTTHTVAASICHAVARHEARPSEPRFSHLTAVETRAQAALFAHILGDPFHPVAPPDSWPRQVPELAQALYDGQPCHFALHDVLAEAGLTEWAEHFRDADHPKGCWALDLLLGKA
jgi:hypothetical protein